MGEILYLSELTWAGKQGSAISSSPTLRGFYTDLARVAAGKGWLQFGLLRKGGQLIAYDYNLVYQGTLYNLKGGYDPVYQHLSPGNALSWLLLKATHQVGSIRIFDFLGEDEPYKMRWTSEVCEHVKLTLFRQDSRRARFLHFLDSGPASRIRRIRRRLRGKTTRARLGVFSEDS